ncbi:CMRF35-like molecule 3 isoform X2 [Carassius auratus]|uniref:CMRF35-like molecule 3 isoform X2 n=1 Tax=Carassius auratus TaxID=7957 RepID=A0A6P6RF33_CARAU|nr:CMRF35-like molecule 3 isoform X2 [Carassius auratus]XP_026144451.1 CMRF35-like molecule 3 isoform X2 [Carassius auratus]
MWSFLLLWFCMGIVVVGAPVTVTGYRGERADIRCTYESGYESNPKYLCKGECRDRQVIVKSGSPAKDQRFSLRDNRTARVFTVTITDLRPEDAGTYWCGVERTLITDVYSEILLLVEQDIGTTEGPTVRLCLMTSTRVSSAPLTPQTLQAQTSPPDSGSFDIITIVIITAGALVLFFICAVLLTVAIRKKKTCGLVSFSSQGLHLTIRKEEDNTYETETPAVVSNSHTAQSDEAFDTDLDVMTAAAGVRNSVNPDQIYTELNPSRHSHIYQSLTAGSQEESIYHTIHQPLD